MKLFSSLKSYAFSYLNKSLLPFVIVLIFACFWMQKANSQTTNANVHPNVPQCLPGYHWSGTACVIDEPPPPPPPPPPPTTVTYTSLFNSSNFIKTIDLTKPVGAIEGSADASGAITYNIPIFCSPGTNGVQPSVSINYNSQAYSGVAGYGWNISGLSLISRSGKNIYNDGIVQPVKYTTDDGFLLDGMRLNPITGSNGANGTIYAGETETFAKIISNTTTSANNPDWFQVVGKDGCILEFWHTVDSRIKTANGIAYSNHGKSFLDGFWRGAVVGGAAALTGGAIAGALPGLGGAVLGGLGGGIVNGGFGAALNGGDIGQGIVFGAGTGALVEDWGHILEVEQGH